MSVMNEAPENVTGHLISTKDPAQRILGQFVNKTHSLLHQKNLLI